MGILYIKKRIHRVLFGSFVFGVALSLPAFGAFESLTFYTYLISYFLAGHFVIYKAIEHIMRGQIFDEYSLMAIATLAAFFIGEYPEAITVMLLYELGEYFQHKAVHQAHDRIREMLDQRPEKTRILKNGDVVSVPAEEVVVGDILLLKRGERLSHDGVLLSATAAMNTAKITGESEIRSYRKGDELLSGFINEGAPLEVEANKELKDSTLSRLFTLTQEAQAQKAPTELFFRKFAKVYTPVVAILAAMIFILPYFFVEDYHYETWLYRAAVFLVISCPCALVLSIPLTYFAGIGAASRSHILVKGAQFLDFMTQIKSIGFDKTGTLTEGDPKISHTDPELSSHKTLSALLSSLSRESHHPVSRAINEYLKSKYPNSHPISLEAVKEHPGMGLEAMYNGKTYRMGRPEWVDDHTQPKTAPFTEVALSENGQWQASLYLQDPVKEDAKATLKQLKERGITVFMLSGDRKAVVQEVGNELEINKMKGELKPEEKLVHFANITEDKRPAAFVGDGLNDSAVLAQAEVGIAMGNTASDLSIESADVILPGQQISKILDLVHLSKRTRHILWQNIALVFAVKLVVLILGASGYASLWAAIVADVGVCLLAVANASRVLYETSTDSTSAMHA
ncbi:MAG: cadmium-translocating P-type ATPase [Bacteroidetes bacterium]|jgi:Cd2+/Zn2+-exporting ATPase|nr:cadmium-translocating P-type ATPase [Bacteroidota bacterium]